MYGTRLRCSVCFGAANNDRCGRTRNARKTGHNESRQNLSLRTEPINFPYLLEKLWKINRFGCVAWMIVSFRPKNDLSTTRYMERNRLAQWSIQHRRSARQFFARTFQHCLQFYLPFLLTFQWLHAVTSKVTKQTGTNVTRRTFKRV